MNDASIEQTLNVLAETGGGLAVCTDDGKTESFPLPIGGLMSYLRPEEVSANLTVMENAAGNLGVRIAHPFMVLSFLCLSVIPELRITDQGYIDITKGGKQDIFVK